MNFSRYLVKEMKYDKAKYEKMDSKRLRCVVATLIARFDNFRKDVIEVYLENDYLRRKYGFMNRKYRHDDIRKYEK